MLYFTPLHLYTFTPLHLKMRHIFLLVKNTLLE